MTEDQELRAVALELAIEHVKPQPYTTPELLKLAEAFYHFLCA